MEIKRIYYKLPPQTLPASVKLWDGGELSTRLVGAQLQPVGVRLLTSQRRTDVQGSLLNMHSHRPMPLVPTLICLPVLWLCGAPRKVVIYFCLLPTKALFGT